jgi:hypothetical protein
MLVWCVLLLLYVVSPLICEDLVSALGKEEWFWNILKMVYTTQSYWVSGLCPSSGILNTGENKVLETGSVSILRWGVGTTHTLLGPLERANLSRWAWTREQNVLQTCSFWNVVFSSVLNSGRWRKPRNPVILRNGLVWPCLYSLNVEESQFCDHTVVLELQLTNVIVWSVLGFS